MHGVLLAAALLAHPGSYRVEPGASEAGFDLKATMHTVHGSTKDVRGVIHVEPEAGGALALSGRIEIQASAIATGNDKRDATLHSKTLLVDAFPSLLFEPERFAPSGSEREDGSISGAMTGRFTLRGKTKPVSIEATLAPKGANIIATGTFDVAWKEFDVPDPSFFVVRVADVAHARFRAEFIREP